jgi:hypothetical protein
VTHLLRTVSKSDYMLARTCEAKLYFRENQYPDNRASNAYLQLLAEGGYMVEALAKARYSDGIQLEYGRDPIAAFERTREYLSRDSVTLFEATLLADRRLARADIVQKSGNTIRLIEVKSKSFSGDEHARSLADEGYGAFRSTRKPFGVNAGWRQRIEDVAYQMLILERMLPGVNVEPYLVLVDISKRADLNDIPRLFEIERGTAQDGTTRVHTARFTGDAEALTQLDLITEVDVSAEVALVRDEVEEAATRFELLLDEPFTAFERSRGTLCQDCEFNLGELIDLNGFRDCWGELADASPHVLELFSVGTVTAADGRPLVEWLIDSGKACLHDVPQDRLVKKDGTVGPNAARQRRQIECTRSGKPWFSESFGKKIESLVYPIHFVDFEVSRLALPYHAGMRPYGQVVFQWSCHTVESLGRAPVHSEWLNTVDIWPNESFVRSLRTAIGDDGSVLTWSRFEASTLLEIVRELPSFGYNDPELVEWIEDFASNRVVDLHAWAKNDFYHPGMRGRTGIKAVLDALWPCDEKMRTQFEEWTGIRADSSADPYAALPVLEICGVPQDVREGTGAVRAYQAMMYGVEKDDVVAKEAWNRLLLQYCELDTLSMVLVFEYLRRATVVAA